MLASAVICQLRNKTFPFCQTVVLFLLLLHPTSSPDGFVVLMKYEKLGSRLSLIKSVSSAR